MGHRLLLAGFFWLIALVGAQAQTGVGLVIANEHYDDLRSARGAGAVLRAERRMAEMGFRVDVATDLSAAAMQTAVAELGRILRDEPQERVVMVFSGYVVSSKFGTWLMGTNATEPATATIETQGVRLQTVLDIASLRQGGAIVAIADYGFPSITDDTFSAGLPEDVTVPQGVTLVHGSGPAIADFLRGALRPGANLGAVSRRRGNVTLLGFNPPFLTFLPADHAPAIDAEANAWASAAQQNTIEGYEAYLDEFPDGAHAAQAREALEALRNTPERIEAELGLTRNERRAIQRDLTILGYDTRGIDGIFGPGTRTAIRAWQGDNRLAPTGFLDREQIQTLAQQSARRAAELEAEARARQLAEERRDRAYWRDTGAGANEAGLRAYLERYPDGLFANLARDQLARIEAERRAAAQARDRAAWEDAEARDTIWAYRRYLRDFPDGAFAEQARARIEELQGPREPQLDIEAARAREEAMNLPQFTRVVIERRLHRMGFEPGRPDGVFDEQTRQAIRRYQRASNLPPTGYLDESLVARLMTEGLLDILR